MNFITEEWKAFRNIETLQRKAGVTSSKLGALVAKELADNALDVSGDCEVGLIDNNGFYVKDDGEGIDEEILAQLFSINRPLISSKLLRLPTRGALGNGLRVVVGAVTATDGQICVSTKGYKYKMNIQSDGTTIAEKIGTYNDKGTLIEISLGESISSDLSWANDAIKFASGNSYKGKTSGYWYSSESFFELVQSHDGNISDLISQFEGCTGTKAGRILSNFKGRKSNTFSFEESEELLHLIRENSKNVKANRLGNIDENIVEKHGYCKAEGRFTIDSTRGKFNAEIPFVVEAWVKQNEYNELITLINKTPITGDIWLTQEKNKSSIYGCGIYKQLNIKKSKVILNIITPYMPITSDGKMPNMGKFSNEIVQAINKAGSKAKKYIKYDEKSISQKDVILSNIDEAIIKASGESKYRFSQRQLYYAIRPYVISQAEKELEYNNFCKVITDYEFKNGDIKLMYRDNRGTLYHPHIGEDIPVGTISVENYNRPKWIFNKVLYIEKEGFFNILKDNKIPEKYDMALLTSKGYASRAVKDLLDTIGEDSEEEITIFCVHDADASGTKIYDTLQNETKARQGRKVKIINLGLEPEEAILMELEVEKVEKSSKKKAVADYVKPKWQEWLQCNRVELNAMSTPQFIEWLEIKIQKYDKGKVVPPNEVLENKLDESRESELRKKISAKILEENNYGEKVESALLKVKSESDISNIRNLIESELNIIPTTTWNKVIDTIAIKNVQKSLKFEVFNQELAG